MTRTDDLEALIQRVRGLEGPCRDTDRQVGLVACRWYATVDDFGECLMTDEGRFPDHPGAQYPSFTESLDAVVSLIERELPGQTRALMLDAINSCETLEDLSNLVRVLLAETLTAIKERDHD
jgi:hypothetical protein